MSVQAGLLCQSSGARLREGGANRHLARILYSHPVYHSLYPFILRILQSLSVASLFPKGFAVADPFCSELLTPTGRDHHDDTHERDAVYDQLLSPSAGLERANSDRLANGRQVPGQILAQTRPTKGPRHRRLARS